jgi:UDP-N-acetylglucosamine--N-acetylmuramyl-(pentapeptide) pyrophosphoryl-undecaprenol N-acetylglucosamine transferase
LALKKPNLLIPLPTTASRGDQILNAKSFESQGFSMMADEDYLTGVILTEKVHELYFNRQQYIDAMRDSKIKDSIETIVGIIEDVVEGK